MAISISKALAERNQRAKGGVQATKARKGKEKVAAPRKLGEAGFGAAIVGCMKAEQDSTREAILALFQCNKETQKLALEEIIAARTTDREAILGKNPSASTKMKGRSSDASYSRIVSIVRAIVDGVNCDEIKKATNLSLMQAAASTASGRKRGPSKKQLQASGFVQWDAKVGRICTKASDAEALARLESHLIHTLEALAKFEQVSSIPVREIVALAAKPKKGMRRAA